MRNGNNLMTKPVVAHVCISYLPISQTFIYRYLENFKQIKPIVLAGSIENIGQFPLEHKIYDCSYKKFTLRWVINGIANKLIGDYNYYRKIVLKISRCQLLHAHFGPTGYFLLDHKKRLRLPLITTFYGYDMSKLAKDKIWQDRYRKLFAEGDLILVEGSNMKKDLIALGCPEDKIGIQHIAIDMKQFSFRERMPKKKGENVVLFFCGRFAEKKGLIYALKAMKRVVPSFPEISFRIVGDGELRQDIEQFVNENKLSEYVELLGFQPHNVVAEEMAKADIFLQPSVTAADGDTEGGAPTILLEAQASGVPILATFHADIPEVVVDGKSGLLAPEKDWKGLANNLLFLLQNQNKWSDFGRAGTRHVAQGYEIRREVMRLEKTYLSLIN